MIPNNYIPLPSSGPISFEQIRAEFGGTGEVSMSQYYRNGGAGVPGGWGGTSRSAAGGASAVPSWGGAGGGGNSSPSGAAGTRGYVQIRI